MANRLRGLIPANASMAEELAARLSPDHRREIRELSGLDPLAALRLSLEHSLEAYAYAPRGGPDALFMMGVERPSPLTGGALLWMLGCDAAARRPAALLRAALWGVNRAFAISGADRLEQFIPDWYRAGLRFVLRLGFGIMPTPLQARNGGPVWHVVRHRIIHQREDNQWARSRTS